MVNEDAVVQEEPVKPFVSFSVQECNALAQYESSVLQIHQPLIAGIFEKMDCQPVVSAPEVVSFRPMHESAPS